MTKETRQELVLQAVRYSQNMLAETLSNNSSHVPTAVREKLREAVTALSDINWQLFIEEEKK